MDKTSILIVEDEGIVAKNLNNKLVQLGYEVAGTATSAEEAVEMALELQPQLILMDIQLSGQRDGIQAAEAVRAQYDVPVIYLTAHSDPATLARAKLTGPFGYILKPFEMRDLATQIELALYKHQADKQVHEQREWLRITLSSIGDAVIATDATGLITFINPVAEALTGWKQDEATGQPMQDVFRIVNEHSRQIADDPVSKVLQSGVIVGLANHTLLLRKGGGEIPIDDSGAPIRDISGHILGVVVVFRDISERRQAEQSLRESDQHLAKELNAARKLQQVSTLLIQTDKIEPLYEKLLDTAIDILDADCASIQMLHREGDHKDQLRLIGHRGFNDKAAQFWEWVGIESESACGIALRTRQRVISSNIEECSFMGSGDREICLQSGIRAVQTTPLVSRSGEFLGMLSTHWRKPHEPTEHELRSMDVLARQAADIIDRTQAEEKLRILNETLEQQVAERTGLAEARARQLQILAVELIESEERERRRVAGLLHDDLQQILASARMRLRACNISSDPMLSDVERLLSESIDKSRRLSLELNPAVLHHSGLAEGLKWLTKHMDEAFGLIVQLGVNGTGDIDNAPLKLFLFRAVQELLFNVVKHSGVKKALVELTRRNGFLVLTVSDRGKGLNPQILDNASAPSGLGLLSLRERALYIGGSFVIESAPDLGSRFTLTVPAFISGKDEARQPPNEYQTDQLAEAIHAVGVGATRVLFVDDHKVMRQGLINLIGNQPGIHVAGEASNGREAIEQTRNLKPDVIVMDVSMPVMDGIEATRHIKTQWPEVRVIGLSMVEDEHISQAMLKAGAETFLSKTASAAELLKAIYGSE